MRLKFPGKGDFGKGGNGDLYVEINELKDDYFTREDDNIITNVKVPFYTAILGGEVSVPSLDGRRNIDISPGTAPGTKVVVRNAGTRKYGSNSRGDEIIVINVDIPKTLSHNERELIEQFKSMNEGKDGGKSRKFGLF